MSPVVFHRELNAAETEEIAGLAMTAGETASIPADLPPVEQATRIRDFLETPGAVEPEQASTLAFTLGSLYGVLVERAYGWKWGVAKFDDGQERYGVFSADRKFGIVVHELFFNHLTDARKSNFVLLFGLLAQGTPKAPPGDGVMLLA